MEKNSTERPGQWRGIAIGFAAALVMGAAAAGGAVALAADQPGGQGMMQRMHHHMMERRLAHLKAQLKLSDQQSALWDSAVQKMKPPADAREHMRAQHEQFMTALNDPNWDPRQWAQKMDQMQGERAAHMKEIRDAWFAVWDSLDANQRTLVRNHLRDRAKHMGHGHHGDDHEHGPGAAGSAAPAKP